MLDTPVSAGRRPHWFGPPGRLLALGGITAALAHHDVY